jgi:hypothetical protein
MALDASNDGRVVFWCPRRLATAKGHAQVIGMRTHTAQRHLLGPSSN